MFDGFDVSWPLRLAIGLFTALVATFLLAPSLIVVPMSFSASELLQFPPTEFSLRWWQQYWQSDLWMPATKTSLLLATVTAAGAVPIAFAAAYATTRSLGWAKLPLYGVLLMPATVPPILVAIGLFFVLARMHLVGSFPGLWLGHTVIAIPTAYVILSAGFARFEIGHAGKRAGGRRRLGKGECLLEAADDDGIERAVERLDAGDRRLDKLARADLAPAHEVSQTERVVVVELLERTDWRARHRRLPFRCQARAGRRGCRG